MKLKTLKILIILTLFSGFAFGEENLKSECHGEAVITENGQAEAEACGENYNNFSKGLLSGSETFVSCQKAIGGDWKNNSTKLNNFNEKMLNRLIGHHYLNEDDKNLANAITNAKSTMATCAAIAVVAREHFANGDNEEDIFVEGRKETQKSFDQKIICRAGGAETIDYLPCMKILNAHNASQVVVKGNEAIQQFRAQDFSHEEQMKLMQASSSGGDTSTIGLESQKNMIDKNQGLAEERRMIQAARLAMLEGFIAALPKNADIVEACSNDRSTIIDTVMKLVKEQDKLQFCRNALNNSFANHALLDNQRIIMTAHAIAAEAGVEMAKEQVAVSMLGKQKKMINGIIDKVKNAEVIALPDGFGSQDELIKFCDLNPQAVECNGLGTGFTSAVGPGGSLSISGDFGSNTIDSSSNSPIGIGGDNSASDGKLNQYDIPTSKIGSSIDKGAGFSGNIPGRAKVSSAGANAAAGGGAGAGATAAGLSGGGGAGGPQAADSPKSKDPKLAYIGGGRSLTFGGGSGVNSRNSSKDSGNPFDKLLNKKKGDDVLNFRDLASQGVRGKNSNLFQAISDTYSIVDKKERLLKYDTIKKK